MSRYLFLFLFLLSISSFSLSQDKLVIDDRAGILSEELETVLTGRMDGEGITYSSLVDFRDACSYYYAGLEMSGNDLILRIMDCDKKELGGRNMGASISSASGEEQALLLSYAIRDIIAEPGKYMLAESPTLSPVPETDAAAAAVQETASTPLRDSLMSNEHDSRYFFAPSAFNLKKGEFYYNTVYFLLHDIQYGINDYFSMGMGTTLIGMPLYLTPKVSIPLGEKNALGFGDLLMFGTWGTDFMGNLAYGVFTHGGRNGNFTIGAGHLWTNDNEITNHTSSLVGNFSAMTRLGSYMFLMNENYLMSANFRRTASFYGDNEYVEESFEQRNTFLYGILGIRIISKNRSFMAWQFGLTYIINYAGDIPNKYLSPGWELDYNNREPGDINLFAIPTVTFTLKFATGN